MTLHATETTESTETTEAAETTETTESTESIETTEKLPNTLNRRDRFNRNEYRSNSDPIAAVLFEAKVKEDGVFNIYYVRLLKCGMVIRQTSRRLSNFL